ncbi:MAG: glycosyltransferase family 39 protein [Opitutaceae bacterium]|nr:glycosyltransferase family 39 protein [Opitutaceae bacterium]
MAPFLAHTAILLWLSFAAARRLHRSLLEQLLGAIALSWANIVVTSLALSAVGELGAPAWYFRTSLLLALATWLALRRVGPEPGVSTPGREGLPATAALLAAGLTLLPVVYASFRIAGTYPPNNYDSLTYHLPRVMYYLGQGDLAHFATGNPRQTYFPFNFNLLQLHALQYSPGLQALTFINLTAWLAAGLAVYRLARLAAAGPNAALVAAWLAMTSTQVMAQATATTNDLPTGAGLLGFLLFALRWRETRLTRDALLAGLCAGLTAGSKLTVVFFAPASGLLALLWAWSHWRRGEIRAFLAGATAWILPAVLGLALAVPFALVNLAEKGEWINKTYDFTLNRPFTWACVGQTSLAYLVQMFLEPLHRFTFDLGFTAALNTWGTATFFPRWNEAYAFSPLYLFPPDLNEDHVWFGLTGPVVLIAAVFAVLRLRHRPVAAWLGWLGLGWFATYFLLNKWSLYNQRYFVPAILVLSPCLALFLEAGWNQPALRRATRNLVVVLAVSALWLAGIYLFQNTSRPYAPLWAGLPPPPALPALPPLMTQRMLEHERINIDSTDGNERIFLLMAQRGHQRFTARSSTQPDRYNVYSQWGFVRKVAYSNIEQLSSYTIVEVPAKRTAGVEFLGTIGSGQPAIDYYGLPPHPENQPSSPGNRGVLVVFSYGPREPGRYANLGIKVAGLNDPDHARLRVGVEYVDGTNAELAAFEVTGEAQSSVTRPFRRFTMRVEDRDTGELLGRVDLPYLAREEPPEIEAPQNPFSVLSEELVAAQPGSRIRTTGLAPPEGPYPQWDLPLIRWAKAPVLRLEIPETRNLERLEFSFELRLHTREAARFDVCFNGEIMQSYDWANRTGWFIRTLTFTPRPGRNVIEIRNVAVSDDPDWLDYLERYPDVKAYVAGQGIAPDQGAREHWEAFGRKENRTLFNKRTLETVPGEPLYYMFRRLRVEGFRNL